MIVFGMKALFFYRKNYYLRSLNSRNFHFLDVWEIGTASFNLFFVFRNDSRSIPILLFQIIVSGFHSFEQLAVKTWCQFQLCSCTHERVGWLNFRELGMSKWIWDYEIQFLTKTFVEVPIFRLLVIKHHIELSQVTVMVDFRFQFILISKFKKLTNTKQPTMSFPWIADICSWYF